MDKQVPVQQLKQESVRSPEFIHRVSFFASAGETLKKIILRRPLSMSVGNLVISSSYFLCYLFSNH